jgi:hypothetical protein
MSDGKIYWNFVTVNFSKKSSNYLFNFPRFSAPNDFEINPTHNKIWFITLSEIKTSFSLECPSWLNLSVKVAWMGF